MTTTTQLERFGAAVLGILAFSEQWDGNTTQNIADAARRLSLDHDDAATARARCIENDLDPLDLGDFGLLRAVDATDNLPAVRRAASTWRRACESDDDDEPDAARALVDELLTHSGLQLVEG